ncbi:MAG: hypothetical protein DRJ57_01810 [Thermoprotei archaeon]|nr:MAG: hypothetical protein DRJ57_01810 [Thermoprotei archaeon]
MTSKPSEGLVELASGVIKGLKELRDGIAESKRSVESMPFLIRGYAAADFKSGTGMSHDEWLEFLDDLITSLEELSSKLTERGEAEAGGVLGKLERAVESLNKLSEYLRGLPQKARLAAGFLSEEQIRALEEGPKRAEEVSTLAQAIKHLMDALRS